MSDETGNQTEVDEAKKKPWWKHRRVWGGVCIGLAGIVATIPGAPVIVAVGAVAITTGTVSATLAFLGTFVFGYGKGAADERAK